MSESGTFSTSTPQTWSVRRVILFVAIALLAIPFIAGLVLVIIGAALGPDSPSSGIYKLLGAFVTLVPGVVLLGLIPMAASHEKRKLAVGITTCTYLFVALAIGIVLTTTSGYDPDAPAAAIALLG